MFPSLLVLITVAVAAKATPAYVESEAYASGLLGAGPYQTYNSSAFEPVQWNYAQTSAETPTPGLIFIAPLGSDSGQVGGCIFNQDGTLVYDAAQYGITMSFYKVTYKEADHLLMWTGSLSISGYGYGHYLLLNTSYDVVANFTTTLGDTLADFHDGQLFGDTAMMTVYPVQSMDLSSYGGAADGWILNAGFQQISIESGEGIFAWQALDHVDPSECYTEPGLTGFLSNNAWDFFHINAVSKDDSGNFLISSRHCHTVYYLDGDSGDIIWRMGGKNSSFTMNNGTEFQWQHDARWRGTSRISLFDNAATAGEMDAEYSRGLLLELDMDSMTVSLVTEYLPYNRATSMSQGNVQILDNETGAAIIGWGQQPWFSQHSGDGQLQWAVQFGVVNVQAYRTYLFNWTATPSEAPSISVSTSSSCPVVVYVTWNGATEIASWELFGSNTSSSQDRTSLSVVPKTDFETALTYDGEVTYAYFQVAALNSANEYIGYSDFAGASH